MIKTPSSSSDLLEQWRHRARYNQRAHYDMEEQCDRRAFWFGVVSASLSGVIGVLILIGVRYNLPTWLRVLTGCLSIVAAAITTVATSGKWSEKAAQHHAVAAEYGKVLRKIEESLVLPTPAEGDMKKLVKAIREKLDEIPAEAPPVSRKIWNRLRVPLTPSEEGWDWDRPKENQGKDRS